jgi:hypothetical protein
MIIDIPYSRHNGWVQSILPIIQRGDIVRTVPNIRHDNIYDRMRYHGARASINSQPDGTVYIRAQHPATRPGRKK